MNEQARQIGRGRAGFPGRRVAGAALLVVLVAALVAACDDSLQPTPPKSINLLPETYLQVQAESLAAQYYKINLRWLGTDPDGHVRAYRYRWACDDLGGPVCPAPGGWHDTTATSVTFVLQVPQPAATYTFSVAAVDDDGAVDATPSIQEFQFYNHPPIVGFETGTKPTQTLPAVTFYLSAVDPDSTATSDDADSRASILQFRAWLDGQEDQVHTAPASARAITFGPEDFGGRYGARTVYIQAEDDGTALSVPVAHTWTVVEPPVDGILLVDDCRMGGNLENFSDQSYRNVLATAAPGRYVVLDLETIPRLSSPDLDATLSLFNRVVWYTDADTISSGALTLARGGLNSLVARSGGLFLSSGVAFGTHGAFGDQEASFRDYFGIDSLFRDPGGSTNFALDLGDTVHAVVQPSLTRFRFLTLGLRAIMECFAARQDGSTESLYFYPAGTFVRTVGDSTFVNPVQFDIGVGHTHAGGAHCVYVSFPIGLPVNDNVGENEAEIRALLLRAGILSP
jgi:hypothetical protein